MSPIECELFAILARLDETRQHQVLDFARRIEEVPPEQAYSARELMLLPAAERERLVIDALALSADENFEIFEAYSEEEVDDLARIEGMYSSSNLILVKVMKLEKYAPLS